MAETRKPMVLRAQRYKLVDAKGRVRAELGPVRNGAPVLKLYDKTGRLRVWLGVTGLTIYDKHTVGKVVWETP
jgi:hypothetical protein